MSLQQRKPSSWNLFCSSEKIPSFLKAFFKTSLCQGAKTFTFTSGHLNFCILIFNSKRFIHYWQSLFFIQCCFRGNDGFHRFHRKLDEDRWNTFVLSSLIKVQQHYSPLNCYENDTLFTCKQWKNSPNNQIRLSAWLYVSTSNCMNREFLLHKTWLICFVHLVACSQDKFPEKFHFNISSPWSRGRVWEQYAGGPWFKSGWGQPEIFAFFS